MLKAPIVKLVLVLILFALSPHAIANTISNVKGKKVLINMSEPGALKAGDRVFATGADGKRKALIQVEKISGNRALGTITKGKAAAGMSVAGSSGGGSGGAKSKSSAASRERSQKSSGSNGSSQKPLSLGIMAGLGLDSMSVKLADDNGNLVETLAMSGTGFSAKGLVDYNFTSYLGVRLLIGLEKFNVTGTSATNICDGTTACKTDIMYITLDGWLRYAFVEGSTNVWVGAGGGVWLPGSKTTNTLDDTSIGTTFAVYFGGGADFAISDDAFVPVQAEYILLPTTEQVSANAIAFRGGIGFRF